MTKATIVRGYTGQTCNCGKPAEVVRVGSYICGRCAAMESRRYTHKKPKPEPDEWQGIYTMFERGYRRFLAKRGMVEETAWLPQPIPGKPRPQPNCLKIGRADIKRAFIRRRQLELGEDPDEFKDTDDLERTYL